MYYFIPLSVLVILLSQEAYYAVLALVLFAGFYEIVVISEKYKYMKEYIERFFYILIANMTKARISTSVKNAKTVKLNANLAVTLLLFLYIINEIPT